MAYINLLFNINKSQHILTRLVWDLVSHGNILLLNGIDYYVYIVNTVLYITHSDYLKWWNNCI